MSRFCVIAGTKITLNGGKSLPIEQIKAGEEVLSFDLNTLQRSQKYDVLVKLKTNDFSGIIKKDYVKNIWKNTADEYFAINDRLKITGDHIVLAKRDSTYYWTKVFNLKIGDYLFTEFNIFEKIETIILIKERVKVFNLEVNSIYNYFANSYLIHNGAPCSACAACGLQTITYYYDSTTTPQQTLPKFYGGFTKFYLKTAVVVGDPGTEGYITISETSNGSQYTSLSNIGIGTIVYGLQDSDSNRIYPKIIKKDDTNDRLYLSKLPTGSTNDYREIYISSLDLRCLRHDELSDSNNYENRFGTTKFIGKNPLSFYDSSGNPATGTGIRNNFEATELVIPSDVNICFFELWGADSQAKGQDDFESQKPGKSSNNANPTIIAGCDQIDDGDNYQSHNSVSSTDSDYVIHYHSSTSIIDNLNSELRTHGRGAYLRGFFLCNPGDYLYIGIGETNIERLGTHGTRDSGHYIDVGSDPPEVGNVTTFNGGGCGQRRFSRGGTQTDLTYSAKPGFSGGGCSFISYLPSGSSDNQRNASKMELYRYRRVGTSGTSAISENFTRIIAVAGGGGGKGSEEDGGGGGNGGAMYGAPLNINGSIDGSLVKNTQTSDWANALTASPDYDFDTTNKVEDTNGNEIGFVINGTFGQRHKDGNTSRKGGGGGGIKGGQSPGGSFNGTNFFDGSGHDGIFGFGGGRPLERGPLSDDKASASSSATNISGQDFSNYDIGSGTAESKFYTDTDNGMPTANIGRGHLSPINHNRSAFQGGGGGGGFFGGHTASAAGGGGGGGSSYVKLHGAAGDAGLLSKTNCDDANQINISTSNSFNDFYPTGSTLPRFYEVKVQRSSVRTGVKHSSIPYFDHTNYQEYDSIDTTGGGAGVHSDRYTQTRGHGGCVMMFKQISSVPSTNLVLQVITAPTNFRRTLTFHARAYEDSDVSAGSNWWPSGTGSQTSNRTNTPSGTGRKINALFQSKMPYGFYDGTYQTELVYRGAYNPDYTPEPIDIIISGNSASGPNHIRDGDGANLTTEDDIDDSLAPTNILVGPSNNEDLYEVRWAYIPTIGPTVNLYYDYESGDNVHTAVRTNSNFSGMVSRIIDGEVSIFPAGQDKYIHTDGYYNGTDVSGSAVSGVIKINSMPLGYRVGDILKITSSNTLNDPTEGYSAATVGFEHGGDDDPDGITMVWSTSSEYDANISHGTHTHYGSDGTSSETSTAITTSSEDQSMGSSTNEVYFKVVAIT